VNQTTKSISWCFDSADGWEPSVSIETLGPHYYPLGGRANFACVQNPTKADFEAGRYLPRLTLARRKVRGSFTTTLRIEFSAPKLLFGNNFDELTSRDFEAVLVALRRALAEMGVPVADHVLRAARVSAVHYSKNIVFSDYTSCSMVTRELDRIDLDGRLDLSRTDWRNSGHAVRYHANSFEFVFYDKLKDLERAKVSEKRAIESDSRIQLDLFVERANFPKQLEVLRLEVRLGSRKKIVSLLKEVQAAHQPTFAALFDASLAQDILLHFWQKIRRQLPFAERSHGQRPEDVLMALARAAQGDVRPGALLQQLGSALLVQSVGVRGAGALMRGYCSARSWQRIKRQIKNMPLLAADDGFPALDQLAGSLRGFRPVRLDSLRRSTSERRQPVQATA